MIGEAWSNDSLRILGIQVLTRWLSGAYRAKKN